MIPYKLLWNVEFPILLLAGQEKGDNSIYLYYIVFFWMYNLGLT
jgi:hypothetical protein